MGRIGVGKVDNGTISVNQEVVLVNHHETDNVEKAKEIIQNAIKRIDLRHKVNCKNSHL